VSEDKASGGCATTAVALALVVTRVVNNPMENTKSPAVSVTRFTVESKKLPHTHGDMLHHQQAG